MLACAASHLYTPRVPAVIVRNAHTLDSILFSPFVCFIPPLWIYNCCLAMAAVVRHQLCIAKGALFTRRPNAPAPSALHCQGTRLVRMRKVGSMCGGAELRMVL